MNWNEVICTKCGLINDYRIAPTNGQLVCYCNGCNKFLGCKPHHLHDEPVEKYVPEKREYVNKGYFKDDELKLVVMPFGAHKGEFVMEIDDKYLWWLYENVVLRGVIKRAVHKKLNIVE